MITSETNINEIGNNKDIQRFSNVTAPNNAIAVTGAKLPRNGTYAFKMRDANAKIIRPRMNPNCFVLLIWFENWLLFEEQIYASNLNLEKINSNFSQKSNQHLLITMKINQLQPYVKVAL
jgi:hypothetical protein